MNYGGFTFTTKQLLELHEYAKNHTREECANHFGCSPSTITYTLQQTFGTYCRSDGLTYEDWVCMYEYYLQGATYSEVKAKFKIQRSIRYISYGFESRFGADYKLKRQKKSQRGWYYAYRYDDRLFKKS